VQEGVMKEQTISQVHIEMLKDHQGISTGTAEILVVSEKVGQLVTKFETSSIQGRAADTAAS